MNRLARRKAEALSGTVMPTEPKLAVFDVVKREVAQERKINAVANRIDVCESQITDMLVAINHQVELWQAYTTNPDRFKAHLIKHQYPEALKDFIDTLDDMLSAVKEHMGVDVKAFRDTNKVAKEYHKALTLMCAAKGADGKEKSDGGAALLQVIKDYLPAVDDRLNELKKKNKHKSRGEDRDKQIVGDFLIMTGHQGMSNSRAYKELAKQHFISTDAVKKVLSRKSGTT